MTNKERYEIEKEFKRNILRFLNGTKSNSNIVTVYRQCFNETYQKTNYQPTHESNAFLLDRINYYENKGFIITNKYAQLSTVADKKNNSWGAEISNYYLSDLGKKYFESRDITIYDENDYDEWLLGKYDKKDFPLKMMIRSLRIAFNLEDYISSISIIRNIFERIIRKLADVIDGCGKLTGKTASNFKNLIKHKNDKCEKLWPIAESIYDNLRSGNIKIKFKNEDCEYFGKCFREILNKGNMMVHGNYTDQHDFGKYDVKMLIDDLPHLFEIVKEITNLCSQP